MAAKRPATSRRKPARKANSTRPRKPAAWSRSRARTGSAPRSTAPPPMFRGALLGVPNVVELPPSEFPEISDPKKRAYITALALTGKFDEAAAAAGVTLRTGWNWRHDERDEAFQSALKFALALACDRVEAEITRRAIDGVEEPVYQQGRMVGTVRKYSDTLLIFKAKGLMPETYRERYEHTGKDGSDLFAAAVAAADQRLAGFLAEVSAARDASAAAGPTQ
jgi:hypothetical protein